MAGGDDARTLDELRRVAYGRTTSPAEEVAAAKAREELAAREAREAPVAEDAQPQPEIAGPGYFARLGASWRMWVLPASAAFVLGIAVAVASVTLLKPDITDFEPEPGNLEAASERFAEPQTSEDVFDARRPDIDDDTTRLISSTARERVFAAMGEQKICLIVADIETGTTYSNCQALTTFEVSGVVIDATTVIGERVVVRWDGESVLTSRADS
jgi:hypothetical protein